MIIIVDGYNVLRGVLEGGVATEQDRNQFQSLLRRYARFKKHKMIVVFDGGQSSFPEKIQQRGLTIIYSGYIDTADDLIKKKLTSLHGKDVLLVSSDRELNVWASKYDIPSIGAQDFYELIQSSLAEQQASIEEESFDDIQLSSDINQDLDRLMEEATRVVPLKQQDMIGTVERRQGASYKQSKINRKLLDILKKL